jgi:hypothetical protein
MFFPLAMLYGIYSTFLPRQLLGYELEEKQYNIFPPGPVFFLLVTEKLVKKLMGERKLVFFSHFHIFPPMDHAVFGSPSQTVTVLRCMKMMIFTLGLNVHSSACKFNDFVLNNPDNCSFNHFFVSIYFYQLPFSLSGRLHSSQYAIDNTPLFLGKTNNLMVYNAHKAVIYTYFLKKYK